MTEGNTQRAVKPPEPGEGTCSNQVKGQRLLIALEDLLGRSDPETVPIGQKGISRKWIAEALGCSPVTLSSNGKLRAAIGKWESKHRLRLVRNTPAENDDIIAYPDNVILLHSPVDRGQMLYVSVQILRRHEPVKKTVPTLVWRDGMDLRVGEYAAHLIFVSKLSASSAEEVVKKLRLFRRFQRQKRTADRNVDNDFLLAWQENMAKAGKASLRRRDECISTVHDFFKWLQAQGYLHNHVRVCEVGEHPDLPVGYIFPIESKLAKVRGRGGGLYSKWISNLLGGADHSSYGRRHTPTSEEIIRLGDHVASHGTYGSRNKLLMDVALLSGARISEIVQLKVKHIPPLDEVFDKLYTEDGEQTLDVPVKRKKRGMGLLRLPPELVIRLAEYIECDPDRAKIVARFSPGAARKEQAIFLSEKTGKALTTDSITRIFGSAFAEVVVLNANIHRLRARYITEIIENCIDDHAARGIEVDPTSTWTQTILIMATNLMGHSSPQSLEPYLNEILQRRQTLGGRILQRTPEQANNAMLDIYRQLNLRLSNQPTLLKLGKLMDAGDYVEAHKLAANMLLLLNDLANSSLAQEAS